MIRFQRTIGWFNDRQPFALDEAKLHVVDRGSRAPLPGYDYSLRAVPLSTITRVDVVRQTSVERIWAGLLLTAGSLLSIAILIGSLRTDRLYLHPLLWLGAFLGVPTGLVLCFNRRQTTVTFVVNDQRFSLPLSDRRWKQDGKQILEVLKRGGVRCEFYGCDPPGEDTASEP